jgi:hypothetical protein
MFVSRIPKLVFVLWLFFLVPAAWAATKTMGTSGTTSAIDTLTFTLEGGDGALAAGVVVRSTTFQVAAGTVASMIIDSIAANSVDFSPFGVTVLGPNTVRFLPPSGGNIAKLKITGVELTEVLARKGITYTVGAPGADKVPALTPYGIVLLILLLVGTALYLFRRKAPRTV